MAKKKKKKQQPKVVVKKKGGFFGKLLAFIMGIFMGIVGGFGGLAAIVYLVLSNPIKDTVDTIEGTGVELPFELTDFITEDLANLSLLAAIQSVGGKIGGIATGAGTLQDLVNDSPYLAEQVGGWAEFLAGYGVLATEEELLKLNFPNIPTYLGDKVNSISIASLLSGFGGAPSAENGFLCALLYGKEGVHYSVNGENVVELLPRAYIFNAEHNIFTDWDDNVYYWGQDPQTGVSGWALEENPTFYITELDVSTLSETDETVHYTYEIRAFDSDSDPTNDVVLYKLSQDPEDATRYLVYENDVLQKHTGLTIGGITQGEGITGTINNMELFDLLNMDETTDDLMLALAGYEKVDGNLRVQEGKSPTTISTLMSGTGNLINDMKVADLLDIDGQSNKLMISLAYEDGYTIDENNVIHGTKKSVSSLTSGNLMDGLYVADILDITPASNKLMLSLAYDSYEIDDKGTTDTSDDEFKSLGNKKTINSLTDANLVNDLEIATVLDLNGSSNPVILSLAYGDNYEIEKETNKVFTFEEDGETKNYSSKKLSELTGSDNPVNDMKLSTLLGLKADSDPIMLSLAYGNYSIDNNNNIVPEKDEQGNDIDRTVGEFTANATDIMQTMQLSKALKLNKDSNSLMLALAYGNDYEEDDQGKIYTEGADGQRNYNSKTVSDLTNPESNLMNDLKISTVLNLNANSDPIMLSLAYGNYEIQDGEVVSKDGLDRTMGDLTSQEDGAQKIIQDFKLPVVLGLTKDSNTLMLKIAYGEGYIVNGDGSITLDDTKARTVANLTEGNFIDDLMLGDVIDNCDSSSLLKSMKDWKISEISTNVNKLTLGEVIDTTKGPKLLQSLATATLVDTDPSEEVDTSIAGKIDTLTLDGMMDVGDHFILKHLKNSTLSSLADDITKLTFEKVFANTIYDENGQLMGTWKYLLTDMSRETGCSHTDGENEGHNIKDIGALITHMTENIRFANLYQLDKDGILDLDDTLVAGPLGQLTIAELLSYVSNQT